MLLHELITKVGSPFVLHYDEALINIAPRFRLLGVAPFVVSLGSAKDESGLFESFRIAMRMPYNQITNWDAFEEATGDLSWVPHKSINIVVEGTDSFYRRDPQSFRRLVDIIEAVGPTWAVPVSEGEWWDRCAVPSFRGCRSKQAVPVQVSKCDGLRGPRVASFGPTSPVPSKLAGGNFPPIAVVGPPVASFVIGCLPVEVD